jgi:type I restriction enzyme S subunit
MKLLTKKAISGELTGEDVGEWEDTTLGEVGKWRAGSTPLKSRRDYYEGGTIPWLVTGNLTDGYIKNIPTKITPKALEETSVKLNPVGSVLIAMYGATIGKLGILEMEATTNQACNACVVNSAKIWNIYLFVFLSTIRDQFISLGEGGAQPNISKQKIVDTPIHLPPLATQRRIVQTIEQYKEVLEPIIGGEA